MAIALNDIFGEYEVVCEQCDLVTLTTSTLVFIRLKAKERVLSEGLSIVESD